MTSRLEDLVVNLDTTAAQPKNIRGGIPSSAWSRDELYARADFEYQRVERRRKDAPRYWMLGKVLRVVRADFSLTQWKTWRDAHSIDRTRAGRAILLARAFRSACT